MEKTNFKDRLVYHGKILLREGPRAFLARLKRYIAVKTMTLFVPSNTAKEMINRLMPLNLFTSENVVVSIDQLSRNRFNKITPLPVTFSENNNLRVNVIVDSLIPEVLNNNANPPIIFSMMLADQLNCPLRVITRDEFSKTRILLELAKRYNVNLPKTYELVNIPEGLQSNNTSLIVGKNDIFIATSWWSALIIRNSSIRKRYIYFLQEYEKIFYPHGDEHAMIDNVLHDNKMIPIINSSFLYHYFKANNYQHIADHGIYFESAHSDIPLSQSKNNAKYNLFFSGQSAEPLSLFYTAIDLIDTAISRGIIKSEEWNIIFAGKYIPNIKFCDGTQPKKLENLNWDQYQQFLSTVDVGIALKHAPYPDPVAFDLAGAGAVVLVNKDKLSIDFSCYSKNIISSDLHKDGLLKNLEHAIDLAKNHSVRFANYTANKINADWEQSFSDIVKKLASDLHAEN